MTDDSLTNQEPRLLCSRRILTPSGFTDGALFLEDGFIVEILEAGEIPGFETRGLPIEDLDDAVVMPGLVDVHVHINEPGRTEWEGFDTATRAAAAGGITTLVDMPLNSSPVTTNLGALEAKLLAAEGQLQVDCGFHGGLVPSNLAAVEPLIDAGICGLKAFLVDSGISEFPPAGANELGPAMEILAGRGIPLLVHAELPNPDEGWQPEAPEAQSYAAYLASRPPEWEIRAIRWMIDLCRETGCAVHIVHLATVEALPWLRSARQEGLPITVETCPHYLYFSADSVGEGDTQFKCAPPIRRPEDREGLWRALEAGDIDLIASDHSPSPPALKELESGDFSRAWGGIASLQCSLPAVWTKARQRGVSVDSLARWMSARPAQLVGLEHRKGSLRQGFDADLVVWRPEECFKVNGKELEHRHPVTPYDGETLFGRVEKTWLRGRKIFQEGKIVSSPTGKALLRQALLRQAQLRQDR